VPARSETGRTGGVEVGKSRERVDCGGMLVE
jgi:hypothetical protein